eukprot:4424143-Heterocapsa_arctica.AAC.1
MLLLAVVTGRSQSSPSSALHARHHITPHGNPWLQQWWHDILEVAKLMPTFAHELERMGWLALFRSNTFSKFNTHRLLRIDMQAMSDPHITRNAPSLEQEPHEFQCLAPVR